MIGERRMRGVAFTQPISARMKFPTLYMKTDIMLLTSVFETFRETCHKTYKIDPGHHFTPPGYTWIAC
ncbi:hypothetical protein NQ317_012430 [Molorchus minor]|uniref:Cytochrome P450 n=1 Tax=Molorchus minor TaxID=1323400 RepID=A0ABQ9JBS5_9CUCU|nr:hypothetical protein NQ317_012430 [Molorchus minor]